MLRLVDDRVDPCRRRQRFIQRAVERTERADFRRRHPYRNNDAKHFADADVACQRSPAREGE